MNLRNLSFLAIIFFTLLSCDDSEAYFGSNYGPTNPNVYSRLSDIIKHDNVPTDTLAFNPLEDSQVVGSFGVKINIPASTAVLGTNVLPEELYVVLREYPSLSKMALSNVQTESNQEMLVTGGNFWWKIIDAEGRDWEIAQPSQVTAEQPITINMGSYAQQAAYYMGSMMNGGNQQVINWSLARNGEGSMNAQNTIFNYTALQLGWTNCDALYDYSGERTQFSAMLNSNSTLATGQEMVLLIPDGFPSVINIYTRQGTSFVTNGNAIPVGLTGTLVAIAINNENQLLIGSTQITVAGDDEFTVDLAPGSVPALTSLLNQVTTN